VTEENFIQSANDPLNYAGILELRPQNAMQGGDDLDPEQTQEP
jgi:hypothetical protein